MACSLIASLIPLRLVLALLPCSHSDHVSRNTSTGQRQRMVFMVSQDLTCPAHYPQSLPTCAEHCFWQLNNLVALATHMVTYDVSDINTTQG